MARNYMQGQFKPLNPEKYKGNPDNIVFRSSWEQTAFKFCDAHPAIVAWNSEETVIPYVSPLDSRPHRYYMDLTIWTKNPKTGKLDRTLVEIKPEKQTRKPSRGNKKEATFLKEVADYAVNQAKWKAARQLCEQQGWQFVIWTERELVPGRAHDKEIQKKTRARTMARKKAMKKAAG